METGKENVRREKNKQTVMELTSQMLHNHYCESDVESVIGLFDNEFAWLGAGEEEYATGTETVTGIFRQIAGAVPRCNIWDEEYHVMELTPEVYLCTGRLWIATDPSSNMYLRVHQRITTVFRFVQGEARCCHIHISNPYSEMTEGELGFPTQMGQQSHAYLQECIERQKKQIEEQTALLERMSYEDSLTGLYNRNKFNQILDSYEGGKETALGVASFDINGLKEVNDRFGHSAGDELICRTAKHIDQGFHGNAYRIGGDEFAVIVEGIAEDDFKGTVDSILEGLKQEGLSSSVGVSWRAIGGEIQEQFDEADKRMYRDKARFYSTAGHDRRGNR